MSNALPQNCKRLQGVRSADTADGMSANRLRNVLPYLQLVRLPNIFTAVADILAGYSLVRGLSINLHDLFCLMLASACIYGGGCALNDVRDFEIDRAERPHRPIPSGAVSRRAALTLSIILLGLGWSVAFLVSRSTFFVAGLLVALVVFYDCLSKDMPFLGSLTMSACRGANLALGMLPGMPFSFLIVFPFITIGYVFWLTALSKFETCGAPKLYPAIISAGILLVLSVPACLVVAGYLSVHALIALGGLLMIVAPPLIGWIRQPIPDRAGRAVKFMVLAIPVLDSVYVMGVQNWILALPVLFCAGLALGLAKFMAVS